MAYKEYKASPLASLPEWLDPERYYEVTPEKRRLQEERVAIRAQLKREYQLQLNDPRRTFLVPDPAVDRWMFARNRNIYPNFRSTTKMSLLGLVWTAGPMLFMYAVISNSRARKKQEYKEGKIPNPFFLGN